MVCQFTRLTWKDCSKPSNLSVIKMWVIGESLKKPWKRSAVHQVQHQAAAQVEFEFETGTWLAGTQAAEIEESAPVGGLSGFGRSA